MYEDLYGKFVVVPDRFETVSRWSVAMAVSNKGRWVPELVSGNQLLTLIAEIEHDLADPECQEDYNYISQLKEELDELKGYPA